MQWLGVSGHSDNFISQCHNLLFQVKDYLQLQDLSSSEKTARDCCHFASVNWRFIASYLLYIVFPLVTSLVEILGALPNP